MYTLYAWLATCANFYYELKNHMYQYHELKKLCACRLACALNSCDSTMGGWSLQESNYGSAWIHTMATADTADAVCKFTQVGIIRGHHVYKQIWTSFIGEELCLQQRYNSHMQLFCCHHNEWWLCGRVSTSKAFLCLFDISRKGGGGGLNVKLLEKRNLERHWRCL